jgi:hypothetical protein
MDKTEFPRLKEEAEANGQFYPLTKGRQRMMKGLGILCAIMIVMVPFSIPMFMLVKSGIWVTKDGVLVKWLGTRFHAWEDFEFVEWKHLTRFKTKEGDTLEQAYRPLVYRLKNRKTISQMAVHWTERQEVLIQQLKKHLRFESNDSDKGEVISTSISEETPDVSA